MSDTRPGRNCPVDYRYPPASLSRHPEIVADAIYIVGGLYGNVEALDRILTMVAAERGAALVFNGDFHWFDVAREDFLAVNGIVTGTHAIRGNVETEIAAEESGAGCGCAYPLDVSDAEVSRSNRILERLRDTAREFPRLREELGALPMNLVAQVGGARVGIVHGDASSLAGWGFAHDRMREPGHRRWLENAFRDSCVDIFASSHTCLPALRTFDFGAGEVAVANNGAAGMPNFAGRCSGILTRIGSKAHGGETLYGAKVREVHVEAIEIAYDGDRWAKRFLASWPEGSPAHDSYWRRMSEGPRFDMENVIAA
ncbi:MAG TPA: hypothetical protein VKR38_03415 [Usitatibacter sp.]|nr:hypothetical protein [Usitatibacter sp.]